MSNTKPLTKFRISDSDLSSDESTSRAFATYSDMREKFADAKKNLDEARQQLRNALDEPLRSHGFVTNGGDWSFRENEDGDLLVSVWSEAKHRGRKKSEVPFQSLSGRKSKYV